MLQRAKDIFQKLVQGRTNPQCEQDENGYKFEVVNIGDVDAYLRVYSGEKHSSEWFIFKNGASKIHSVTSRKEGYSFLEWCSEMEFLPNTDASRRVYAVVRDWLKENNHQIPVGFEFIDINHYVAEGDYNFYKPIGWQPK